MEVSGKRADDVSETCDVCQLNSANGFCNDCKEYMCQQCFQDHKKGKPCRHHVLAPMDQATGHMPNKPYEERCKVHTTENIRYYCRKHNVVGCGDCIVSKHDGCKAEIIKDLAMNLEESAEFKELLRRIKQCDAEKNENVKRLESNIKQNKILVDKALDGIRKFRKEINDYIDQAEQTIIIQANKHSKDNEIMFYQMQQKIDEVAKEIDELREKLDTRVHQGEDLFIRMTECKSKETNVQRSVAEITSKNMIKTYIFQPDQKLTDMLTSNVSFGTIHISDDNGKKNTTCEKTVDKMEQKSKVSSAKKQHIAEIKFSPPDPRAAGFEVGKRVKVSPTNMLIGLGSGTGTIISVDPKGYVDVSWDNGATYRTRAGAGGTFWIRLL